MGIIFGMIKEKEAMVPIKYLNDLSKFLFISNMVMDKKYAGYNCHLAPLRK